MSVCHYRIDSLTRSFRHECISTQSEELERDGSVDSSGVRHSAEVKTFVAGFGGRREKFGELKSLHTNSGGCGRGDGQTVFWSIEAKRISPEKVQKSL